MASDDTPSPILTLELGPGKVPYRDFRRVVQDFTNLLREFSEESCGHPDSVRWEISVSEGSLLIAADIPDTVDAKTVASIQETVRRPPPRIRERLDRFPRPVPVTRLLTGEDRKDILQPDQDVMPRRPGPFSEYGTIEGTLDTLSARGHPYFIISEPIWNIAVKCTVPDDVVDSMREMWRQRVAAHGTVHYDPNGQPTSIKAEEVVSFPYSDMPIEAFRGLLAADDMHALVRRR
ncbi:MAG: hypothetical protein OXD42_06475 [Rhodospirillaceae bacterium]|nr:hypothetical protein [Rhodospirillaceae bacterium]MCY4237238.1 hypothetical protein [Rhodospirillaceae bacterium]